MYLNIVDIVDIVGSLTVEYVPNRAEKQKYKDSDV